MRATIEIDDVLMQEALLATGLGSKREVVELALQTLLRFTRQREMRRYRGKLDWRGDLGLMRRDKRSSSN